MSADRLSVVIPCVDEGGVIERLLDSLQPLRKAGHELILVDGGSTDSTVALAAPHVDHLIDAPRGRARQMNAGAHIASGDILWFLHADSTVSCDAVELIVKGLTSVECCWGRFDVSLSGHHPLLRVVEFMMNWRSRLTGIATGDQGIFVRRHAFFTVGGFPDIALMEDIALSRRLKRLSRPHCLRQRIGTSSRRWEKQGVVVTIFRMWWLRLAFALGADPDKLARQYHQCSSPIQDS
ncbi:TIGR04283 family arsenosugar biosynthesis glycosyltransferase [Solemya velesiana gill symbiont]|uniref:Glycosyl transferase n=1 Tax=Solemya velesiana gill symbiont TaxID=1918948 RepID=A0A1T2KXZ3_9GAMM|nr:TIGR04283 family arsenosugar biosynthesis glycosyltransferase [Solemya velesiana gill symbiont]OOZ37703.1 glycosyl transferase [Solemya velesiana gill symbiont]